MNEPPEQAEAGQGLARRAADAEAAKEPDPAPDAGTPTHDDQLRDGTAEVFSVAKWIVTAFGAVGGAILAAVSFTKLGELQGTELILAAVGMGLATAGVVMIIGLASAVLASEVVTLSDLASGDKRFKKLRDELDRSPELRADKDTVAAYAGWIHSRVTAQIVERKKLREAPEGSPEQKRARAALKAAQEDVSDFHPITNRLRATAQYEFVRRRFADRQAWMIVSGLVAAAGVALLTFSASGDPEAAGAPEPAIPPRPVLVTVDLTEAGGERVRNSIGNGCDSDSLEAIAVSRTTQGIQLITTGREEGCESAAIEVADDEGEIEALEPVDTRIRLP